MTCSVADTCMKAMGLVARVHYHSYVSAVGGRICLNRGCPEKRQVERPAPAQEHSETSKAAAAAIEGSPRAHARATVLMYIQACGTRGATDEAGIAATGLPDSTYRPRRVELVERNVVCDSGQTRLTRAGRSAVVWIAL